MSASVGTLGHMTTVDNLEEAEEILQQLGLKEYEARCFVGLSQLSSGTAKTISEMTGVPRTRVYDSVRLLEANGLVEVHHSSPQQFRAVSIEEATKILREQYKARVDRLQSALDELTVVEPGEKTLPQEVWALSGPDSIDVRTNKLISNADSEIVLIVGDSQAVTPDLIAQLTDVDSRIDLMIGTITESVRTDIQNHVPEATTFISGLNWLESADDGDETTIGRLLLIDRSVILVSSIDQATTNEHAIFGEGFGNGLVVIARRLLSKGLLEIDDPATAED